MLARVTYGLVGLALATLIAGFFVRENNVLLYISIALSVAAIILVLVGAARRAREAPAADLGGEAFAELETEGDEDEELPEEVLAAFEEDEEEFEEEPEEVAPRRTTTRTKAKPKAKPKAAAKKKAAPARSRTPKVLVVPGRDRYHAEGCRFVRGKDPDEVEEITAATAKRRGYEPCSVCSPD